MIQKFSLRSAGLRPLPSGLGLGLGLAFAATALFTTAIPGRAQDASALMDKLVQKGILTTQEANEVRAEMKNDAAPTLANKVSLGDSVTQLKLYGDLRLRWQYKGNTPLVNGDTWHTIEQDRFRYRLRLNADVQLGPNWFAGFELQSGQTADSGFQSYSSAFNNDGIFISKALLGWQNDWLKVVAGKQANPFYTTDLLWDPDINPAGLIETIALHKLPIFGGSAGPSGSGKESATAASGFDPWEVTLVAGQFIAGDNGKFNNTGDLGTAPWIFDEQLIVKHNFNKAASVTFAPGFLAENAAHITGALNTLPFSDEGSVITGTTAVTTTTQEQDVVSISYSAKGVLTKTITPTTVTTTTQTQSTPNNQTVENATVSGPRTITSTASASRNGAVITQVGSKASGLPADPSKANQTFTSTVTGQRQTVSTTNNVTLPAVAAETRALHILTAPGDISLTLGGIKSKLYWDLAYNVSGQTRFDDVYQLKDFGSRAYRPRDAFAWLVGLQFGEAKKKGNWAASVDYRETGIASIDPNLNDNEVAGGALNMRGFKLSLAYVLTDSVMVQATGYIFKSLDSTLSGGRATSPGGIAPYTSYNEVTVDLNIKF